MFVSNSAVESLSELDWDPKVIRFWAEKIGKMRGASVLNSSSLLCGESPRELENRRDHLFDAVMGLVGLEQSRIAAEELSKRPDFSISNVRFLYVVCRHFVAQEEGKSDSELLLLMSQLDSYQKNCRSPVVCSIYDTFAGVVRRMLPYTQIELIPFIVRGGIFQEYTKQNERAAKICQTESAEILLLSIISKLKQLCTTLKLPKMTGEEIIIIRYLLFCRNKGSDSHPDVLPTGWPFVDPQFMEATAHDSARNLLMVIDELRAIAENRKSQHSLNLEDPMKEDDSKIYSFFKNFWILATIYHEEAKLNQNLRESTFTGIEHTSTCECGCKSAIDQFRNCYAEIIELLPGDSVCWRRWSDGKRHNHVVAQIPKIVCERDSAMSVLSQVSKDLTTLQKERCQLIKAHEVLQRTTDRTISSLNRKVARQDQTLREQESQFSSAQELNDKRARDQSELISSLQLKLEAKAKEVALQKDEVDKTKAAWQKKLQAQFTKVTTLKKELGEQDDAHSITLLDLDSRQSELDKERLKVKTAKGIHAQNAEKYAEMKKEYEGQKTLISTLRTNEKVVQDRIAAAVRNIIVEKDAEIARLKLRNLKLHSIRTDQQELSSQQEVARTLAQDLDNVSKEKLELEKKMLELKAIFN